MLPLFRWGRVAKRNGVVLSVVFSLAFFWEAENEKKQVYHTRKNCNFAILPNNVFIDNKKKLI